MLKAEIDLVLGRTLDLAFVAAYFRLTVGKWAEYAIELANTVETSRGIIGDHRYLFTMSRLKHINTQTKTETVLTDWAIGESESASIAATNKKLSELVAHLETQIRQRQGQDDDE